MTGKPTRRKKERAKPDTPEELRKRADRYAPSAYSVRLYARVAALKAYRRTRQLHAQHFIEELEEQLAGELKPFQHKGSDGEVSTISVESQIIGIKQDINDLCRMLGKPARYHKPVDIEARRAATRERVRRHRANKKRPRTVGKVPGP